MLHQRRPKKCDKFGSWFGMTQRRSSQRQHRFEINTKFCAMSICGTIFLYQNFSKSLMAFKWSTKKRVKQKILLVIHMLLSLEMPTLPSFYFDC